MSNKCELTTVERALEWLIDLRRTDYSVWQWFTGDCPVLLELLSSRWISVYSGRLTIRLTITRLQPRVRKFYGARICVTRHTTNKNTLEALIVVDRVNQDSHDHELA